MIICEKFIECCLPNMNKCPHRSPHEKDVCAKERCGFEGKALCYRTDSIELFNIIEIKLNLSKKQILSKIVLSKLIK